MSQAVVCRAWWHLFHPRIQTHRREATNPLRKIGFVGLRGAHMSHRVAPISHESPKTSQGSDKSPHPDQSVAIRCFLAHFVADSAAVSCK